MTEEKQIEEMAKALYEKRPYNDLWIEDAKDIAKVLYAAGYRKQTEGEWISVAERLPENGVHCLLCCDVKYISGKHRQYVCTGFHAEKYKNLAHGVDDDCETDYNEEDDEYYISDGWYEVINNWDDYDCIVIFDTVTHWMPLPEPPKMKGGAE